jgi:hypothetical protein
LVPTLTTTVPEGAAVVAEPLLEVTVMPPPPAAVERVLLVVAPVAAEEVREEVARVLVALERDPVEVGPSSPYTKSATQLYRSTILEEVLLQQEESWGIALRQEEPQTAPRQLASVGLSLPQVLTMSDSHARALELVWRAKSAWRS